MNTRLMGLVLTASLWASSHAPDCRAGTWTNLGSGMNGTVNALAFDASGLLYAAGDFTQAGGAPAQGIARWNGTAWSPLEGVRQGGNAYELAFDTAGHLYAADGNLIERWDGAHWVNISSGMDWYVYTLAADASGALYAGGSFTTVGGVTVNHVAQWNGTAWNALGGGTDFYVDALAFDRYGALYAGGQFTHAGGRAANRIAKWDGSNWTPLGSGIHSGSHDAVLALTFDRSGTLYAGGNFSVAGGVDAFAIAQWNGAAWAPVGGGMDFQVEALACDSAGAVYAGGAFERAGGLPAHRIAMWNGAAWVPLGSGLNNNVTALACDRSGALFAAGFFSTAGGLDVNHIAQWIPSPEGPVIEANGAGGAITIRRSDTVTLTVQLDPGRYQGVPVDWWMVILAGDSGYYLAPTTRWIPFDGSPAQCMPVHQGALFPLPVTTVLTATGLAPGVYTAVFGVDYPMDGLLNLAGPLAADTVTVRVQ